MSIIKHLILFFGKKTKSSTQQRIPILAIASQLQTNIDKCKTFEQLKACEQYFEKMILVYSDDPSISVFKSVVKCYLDIQEEYLKLKKTKKNEPNIA